MSNTGMHKGLWERRLEIFQVYGSVLPRSIPFAVLGSLQGGFMKATQKWDWDVLGLEYQETWYHPYTLHVLGMVLGFSLVMRIQIAYARFWEGTTQCHQASSKWADAAMQARPRATVRCTVRPRTATVARTHRYHRRVPSTQVMAFDEASADAFSEQALEFRMLYIHYTSLMHACALIDIRQVQKAIRRSHCVRAVLRTCACARVRDCPHRFTGAG